ncbi:hypothetical protein HDU67_008370 [Dinochytrium kinnereticum]|nr:hypothetical protein HDU67_008370 [Dinochytrium kinnereticum]
MANIPSSAMPRLQTAAPDPPPSTTVWGGTVTVWNPSSPDSPLPPQTTITLNGIVLGTTTAFPISLPGSASIPTFRKVVAEAVGGVGSVMLFRVNDRTMGLMDSRILRVAKERDERGKEGLPQSAVVLLAAATLVKGDDGTVKDWFSNISGSGLGANRLYNFVLTI